MDDETISRIAAFLGRRGKGKPKTITDQDRANRRERMIKVNAQRAKNRKKKV